jgi:site-specific recombinase XerD
MGMKLPQGVFKRGKGYSVRVTVPTKLVDSFGKKEIIRGLGTRDKLEAALKAPDVIQEIKKGFSEVGRGQPVRERQQDISVRAMAHRWLAMSTGINRSTKAKYRHHLNAFEDWSENVDVSKIDRAMALDYYTHLKSSISDRTGAPLSLRSLKCHLNCLASFYRVLDHFGVVDPDKRNPFSSLDRRLPGQAKAVDTRAKSLRPINRAEALEWYANCEGCVYEAEMRVCLRVLWSTGCRLSEIADRNVSDIVDHGDFVEIQINGGKTDAAKRSLYLVNRADIEAIREAVRESGSCEKLFPRVTPAGYNKRASHTLSKALQEQRKKIDGHKQFDAHSFRRNVVSTLVNLDVPVHVRNLMVGHSNGSDIGVSVYAKRADLSALMLDTSRTLSDAVGGAL